MLFRKTAPVQCVFHPRTGPRFAGFPCPSRIVLGQTDSGSRYGGSGKFSRTQPGNRKNSCGLMNGDCCNENRQPIYDDVPKPGLSSQPRQAAGYGTTKTEKREPEHGDGVPLGGQNGRTGRSQTGMTPREVSKERRKPGRREGETEPAGRANPLFGEVHLLPCAVLRQGTRSRTTGMKKEAARAASRINGGPTRT